jgi:hypothetical protein
MLSNCFRLPLRILAWEAWAGPSLADRKAWQEWAVSDREWNSILTQTPPVSPMPPLLRRRADPADRLGLEVAFRLAPSGSAIPGVFASRHGQVARSTAMLSAQTAGEPASPMEFSMSVHNAAAGQFSIAKGDRSLSSSLSSRGESFTAALLEAQGMVLEGHDRVLVVMSDRLPPEEYRGRWDEEPSGYALGLILGASGGEGFEMSLSDCDAGEDSRPPQALAFLKALAGGGPSASWTRGSRRWDWVRS